MLSYLQPPLASESMLAICSTSSDDLTKSTYQQEDEQDAMFNPASAARLAYPSGPSHKSSVPPFVYGHSSTPSYGFGFGFYDDMPSFTGKDNSFSGNRMSIAFDLDTTRSPYAFMHTTKRADPNIDAKLENSDLWKRFAALNLEMIITKNGR